MSLFAGLGAGWGKGQGEYNSKMLDFINQKNQSLATMYGHLADNAQDQDMASEFMNRAQGWASANPLMDPKGYKELVKREKTGLHDIVDQAHQKKVEQFHQETFNQTPAQTAPAQPAQHPDAFDMAAPPTQSEQPQPQPQTQGQGQPPQQQPDMDQFIRHTLPPEPQMYGAMGRLNPEWQHWHEIYTKKMEGTVQTPEAMKSFMGAPYMPSGFAAPYANLMRTEQTANARGLSQGFKIDPTTHQFVPLRPEEQSLLQQSRLMRDQSQVELNRLTGIYKQAVAQKDMVIAGAALERIAVMKQRENRLTLETSAKLYGIDPTTGKPFPGQAMLDDGTGNFIPVGTMNYRSVMPTAMEQNKAGAGVNVIQHGQNLVDFANNPNNADLFGKLSGRWEDFVARKFGTGDPREAGLRADIRSMASLLSPLHGFRSQRAAEEFLTTLHQTNSPEAFADAVEKYMYMAQHIYDEGMPNVAGAGGKVVKRSPLVSAPTETTKPGGPPTAKFKVGDVFTKGGKKYKVKAILPNGGVDTDEVK